MKTVELIGVPSDFGASELGASLGPDALRIAGLVTSLQNLGLNVKDRGNLKGPSSLFEKVDLQIAQAKYLEQVFRWNQLLFPAVSSALTEHTIPIVLGGDHSIVVGSIAAVANQCVQKNKKLKIVWLDAHADANTPDISPSGNIHGMPVALLLGHGYEVLSGLVTKQSIHASQFYLIGIRSVDEVEKQFVHRLGLDIFDMRYIDEFGIKQVMDQVLADCDSDTHLHVSFDLDALDPGIAPGVSTRVAGGLSFREIQLVMEMLADTDCVGSVDIVELNPIKDIQNKTAYLAVDLLGSLFGKSTLIRMKK
jgi:arginase